MAGKCETNLQKAMAKSLVSAEFVINPCFRVNWCHHTKNSIRDARTPKPREIVFHTMTYKTSVIVQRLGYFQCSVNNI